MRGRGCLSWLDYRKIGKDEFKRLPTTLTVIAGPAFDLPMSDSSNLLIGWVAGSATLVMAFQVRFQLSEIQAERSNQTHLLAASPVLSMSIYMYCPLLSGIIVVHITWHEHLLRVSVVDSIHVAGTPF